MDIIGLLVVCALIALFLWLACRDDEDQTPPTGVTGGGGVVIPPVQKE